MRFLTAAAALMISAAPALAAEISLDQKKCLLDATQKLATTYPVATIKSAAFGPAPARTGTPQPGETAFSLKFAVQVVDVPMNYAFTCVIVPGRGTVVQPVGVSE